MTSDLHVEKLYRIMRSNDVATFEWMLDAHPALARAGGSGPIAPPLISAVFCDAPHFFDALLARGADVNVRDSSVKGSSHRLTAYDAALWFQNAAMVGSAERAGAVRGFSACLFARDAGAVARHIDASPERLGEAFIRSSYSLLHVAVHLDSVPLTEFFLERGLSPNAKDADGHAPLRYAARNSPAVSLIERLVAAGADVNHRSRTGITALSAACRHRQSIPNIAALLQAGADPNLVPDNGMSPLMKAAANRCPETVTLLLSAGADPEFRGKRGESAFEVARRKGHAATVAAFLE